MKSSTEGSSIPLEHLDDVGRDFLVLEADGQTSALSVRAAGSSPT